ncbi:Transcriptional regulator, IclR-family [Cupriavidus necator]|uniref:Transcriptional regulator, IclR-family n=2 Tax=Cupriavidus necator TaxID=106590 RepID=A0A1K0IHJ9_CUPNE|nr:Transcriptional regulator, IclR-family [Cupriavidus necator]
MTKSKEMQPRPTDVAGPGEPDEDVVAEDIQDRHFVTALARGLEVLSCFRTGDSFLANNEIAERCGLPKSTITRLTYTLTKLGYLHLLPDSGKYRLGTATAALGSSALVNLDVRQVARPVMQALAADTGAVVALNTRDRMSMLYLECCRSTSIVTLSLDVGSRIPLGTTAAGRALLAALPASERAELMERIRELDMGTWPAVEKGIREAVDEYQATGCVTSAGCWVKEVHGIAAPIWSGRGMPLMCISVAGAAGYFPVDRLHGEIRPKLLEAVREIERTLGQR